MPRRCAAQARQTKRTGVATHHKVSDELTFWPYTSYLGPGLQSYERYVAEVHPHIPAASQRRQRNPRKEDDRGPEAQ
jgi:hypothetical protein